MSTQDAESIYLSFDRRQQGLRLLELPPELLDLLGGQNPPKLSLKSTAPSTSGHAGHVVLCTPTHTYDLRQVQTSNTVFVTRPVPLDDRNGVTDTSICAFAKCGSMLELHPQTQDGKGKTQTAKELLDMMLRVYSGPEDELDDVALRGSTKDTLFNDIPYSQGECDRAWTELIAFERHHTCWKPHPKVLLQLWNQLLEAATADGIDMSKSFDLENVRSAIEDVAAYEEILDAIMSYLCLEDDTSGRKISLDRARVVDWTGQLVVHKAVDKEQEVPSENSLSIWKETLPEVWREDATTELLNQIREKNKQQAPRSAGSKPEGEVLNSSGKRPAKGRNWHERFKKSRK